MHRLVRSYAVVLAIVITDGAASSRALARQYTLTPIPLGDFEQVVPDDLNSAGQVVGRLVPTGGASVGQHGYVWSAAGGLTDLGAGVLPNAISDQGAAVVGATAGGGAFVWTPAQGVRLLSSLPGGQPFGRSSSAIAHDINSTGQVLGLTSDPRYRAFVYSPAGTVRTLPLPSESDGLPLTDVQVVTLSDAGDAVGWLYFYRGDNFTFRGAVWPAAGGVRLLDDVPGGRIWSQASTLNSRGQVAGLGMNATGQRPVVWAPDGRVIDLGDLPGRTHGGTAGINDQGEVVGYSEADRGTEDIFCFQEKTYEEEICFEVKNVFVCRHPRCGSAWDVPFEHDHFGHDYSSRPRR